MPRSSAGLLMYRVGPSWAEVLLVHPGGPYFRKRDLGAWSIPKGELDPVEDPLVAARREFEEETGLCPVGPFQPLGSVRQTGGKIVHAWAVPGDIDPAVIRSNVFTLQWPPKSGRFMDFPEIDRAAYFDFSTARRKILPAQAEFLDRLQALLARRPAADTNTSK